MSTSVKIFICAALSISAAMAHPAKDKNDLVAAEKAQLAKMAARSDLTVKEFLQFVSDVDTKCTNETTSGTMPAKAEAICSLYYKMLKIEELFTENPNGPNWEQCLRAGTTSDALSTDDSVKVNVNRIASKLCPKN
ncbi:MAG: hypothetical protein B7Y39_12340 [Bdellovibrio sp. 28-41-41]|nr:MAG: hypothetical protein B7Y39_12340 [Bdellovibrio sp. 28-41-41]